MHVKSSRQRARMHAYRDLDLFLVSLGVLCASRISNLGHRPTFQMPIIRLLDERASAEMVLVLGYPTSAVELLIEGILNVLPWGHGYRS